MFKWNFAYFSFCLLPLVLILGVAEKSLILPCFLPSISYLYTLKRSLSSLQAEKFLISHRRHAPLIV